MTEDVDLVGSRVSVMHLAYDCPGCGNTVAVTIADGKHAAGPRRLIQRPGDCPNCGQQIEITVVAETPQRAP
jgi:predicted RNA-binding Zn-ribbon protein involved in translation (DUF1610 family)